MNCKPGDIAVIVSFDPIHPHLTGRLVDVLEAAPVGCKFRLPDGKLHHICGAGLWVLRFHNPVDLRVLGGLPNAVFVACPDWALRPIRDAGDDAADESKAWLPPVPLPAIDPSLIPEKESEHAD